MTFQGADMYLLFKQFLNLWFHLYYRYVAPPTCVFALSVGIQEGNKNLTIYLVQKQYMFIYGQKSDTLRTSSIAICKKTG